MNGRPRMRGIFGLASMSSTMKYIKNGNLSILIITSFIFPNGFLQALSSICSVAAFGYTWRSPILFTTDNSIMFTLAFVSTSAFPTSILPIEIGNMTTPGLFSFGVEFVG